MIATRPAAVDDRLMLGTQVLVLAPVGGYEGFNTSVHRVRALQSLGASVRVLDSTADAMGRAAGWSRRLRSRLFRHGFPVSLNDATADATRLLDAAASSDWTMIWLEKALTIGAPALKLLRARCPGALIVGFSPDDMHSRHNQSLQFVQALPQYDAFLTTKSYNVGELQHLGGRKVCFVGNGYDPESFRPLDASATDIARLGGDVGFIGSYEPERAKQMLDLAAQGISVRVWGNGWTSMAGRHPRLVIEGRPLHGDDFARACSAFTINLGFLRKLNRDQQTTRSVEIPACAGFMLAERTDEHQALFVEGQEAEFFSSPRELAEKCRHYLRHPLEARRIGQRGRARCISSGYSNAARLASALLPLLDSRRDGRTHD